MDAHNKAYNLIKEIILKEKIDCEMREGETYMVAKSEKESGELIVDFKNRKKISNFEKITSNNELQSEINCRKYILAEMVHPTMCLNPLKLVQKISEKIKQNGVEIFENTRLLSYKNNIANTKKAKIKYKHIILALDSYGEKNKVNRILTSIAITNKLSKKDILTLNLKNNDTLIEEQLKNFFYLRPTYDSRLLIGYGDNDIKTIPTKSICDSRHFKTIKKYIKETFPTAKMRIEYGWTSMFCLSKKGILTAKHSKNKSEIYGGGLQTTAVVGALYVLSRIKGEQNELEEMLK